MVGRAALGPGRRPRSDQCARRRRRRGLHLPLCFLRFFARGSNTDLACRVRCSCPLFLSRICSRGARVRARALASKVAAFRGGELSGEARGGRCISLVPLRPGLRSEPPLWRRSYSLLRHYFSLPAMHTRGMDWMMGNQSNRH